MQFRADNFDHPIYIKSFDQKKSEITVVSKFDKDQKAISTSLSTSLIVLFNQIIENWGPDSHTKLTKEDITQLLTYKPEIIILGIGDKLEPLPYHILEPLYLSKIPFEVMSTLSACRTYNLLAGEHRKVAAALIL
ncbi:MAG: hypothetical protein KBD64_05325 [Gammaproteobacteria bacterium]|nr:hypothetical protein [Gammaproteobacteria bacterium]